jgi:hypothetical protein
MKPPHRPVLEDEELIFVIIMFIIYKELQGINYQLNNFDANKIMAAKI